MTSEVASYLAEVPIFQGLNQRELQSIADIAIVRHYKKGMVIFVEGEPAMDYIWLRQE